MVVLRSYDILELSGQGSYGSVVKAVCRFTGDIVAIKLVKNFRNHSYSLIKIVREIQIMRALTQMNSTKLSFFTKLYDLIIPENTQAHNLNCIFFVMDFVETDMSKVI
jgi:serine/threonine protein kinase